MRTALLHSLLGIALCPSLLLAEPCVTANYDRPLPGSTGVEFRASDVPSARFPTFWQTGSYLGFTYKLYSNGEAVVASDIKRPDWKVDIACADTCTFEPTGDVPTEATQAAQNIGQCLLGQEKTPEPEAVVEVEVIEEPATVATPNTGACAATSVPEGGTVITLQRLLVVAGTDPGPIDGFIGRRTMSALSGVLGAEIPSSELDQALQDLRLKLCEDG